MSMMNLLMHLYRFFLKISVQIACHSHYLRFQVVLKLTHFRSVACLDENLEKGSGFLEKGVGIVNEIFSPLCLQFGMQFLAWVGGLEPPTTPSLARAKQQFVTGIPTKEQKFISKSLLKISLYLNKVKAFNLYFLWLTFISKTPFFYHLYEQNFVFKTFTFTKFSFQAFYIAIYSFMYELFDKYFISYCHYQANHFGKLLFNYYS